MHGGAVTVHKMQNYTSLSFRVSEHREEKENLLWLPFPLFRRKTELPSIPVPPPLSWLPCCVNAFPDSPSSPIPLEVFQILSGKEGFQTILTGGFYMPGEKTFYGHLALDMIKQLHVSKFFLAPSAVP